MNKRRSKTRRMVGEIIRALVLVILGGALAWMILCVPEAGAADIDGQTMDIHLESGEIKFASVCFESIDGSEDMLCYYATRENIPLPEWPYRVEVRIWQLPEKITLETAIHALQVVTGVRR